MHDTLLTLSAASERLAVSERTVRRLIDTGDLPPIRVRGAIRVSAADIAALIDRARAAVCNPPRAAVPETDTCQQRHNRTGFTGERTRRTGGRASLTGEEDRLGALLAFRSRPTRKG